MVQRGFFERGVYMRNLEITVLKCAGAVVLSFPLVGTARVTFEVMSLLQLVWCYAILFAMVVFVSSKLRQRLADALAKAPALVHKVVAFLGHYDGVIWPVWISSFMISVIIAPAIPSDHKIGMLEMLLIFNFALFAVVGGLYAFRAAQKGQPFWSTLAKHNKKQAVV